MRDMGYTLEKCKKQCKYLVIKEKNIKPEGCHQDKYNEASKEFDISAWKEKIIDVHSFLMSKGAKYIEQPRMYIYI
jgi:hypothetical protein